MLRIHYVRGIIFWFLLTICSSGSLCFAKEKIHWGKANGDLRLGVGISQRDRDPQFDVFFANQGKRQLTLYFGNIGVLSGFGFRAWAINPKTSQKKWLFIYTTPGNAGVLVKVGLPLPPIMGQIPGGATRKVSVPLSVLGRDLNKEQSARTLLRQGYKLFATYDYSTSPREKSEYPDMWVGKIISGEVGLPETH